MNEFLFSPRNFTIAVVAVQIVCLVALAEAPWWLLLAFYPTIWEMVGPTNGTLSFYECQFPTCCNWIHLNFWHSQAVGMLKHWACAQSCLLVPTNHVMKLYQRCGMFWLFAPFFRHNWIWWSCLKQIGWQRQDTRRNISAIKVICDHMWTVLRIHKQSYHFSLASVY